MPRRFDSPVDYNWCRYCHDDVDNREIALEVHLLTCTIENRWAATATAGVPTYPQLYSVCFEPLDSFLKRMMIEVERLPAPEYKITLWEWDRRSGLFSHHGWWIYNRFSTLFYALSCKIARSF